MDYLEKYSQWQTFDPETKAELSALTDAKEIEDRFYRDLAFGTGGLRGLMGAGTNRMNTYTVRRATLGLANYLNSRYPDGCRVAIAYDSRHHSRRFAEDTAGVLCASGIRVALFDSLMPTPVLSFAVRHLGCQAGVVITASHNPKEYNGYKVYDEYGCQLVPRDADQVIRFVEAVARFTDIPTLAIEEARSQGLLEMVGDRTLDAFVAAVMQQSSYRGPSSLKVVYTPLHGTGNRPVRMALQAFDVSVVREQELPDGDFPTVRSPNPEDRAALTLALQQAAREDADLVLGTDPDCDRVGVGVKWKDDYVLLTGNQIGALLVDFVLAHRTLDSRSTLVKTIVTNELGANIARRRGLQVVDTLTGFKYIGDQITQYEKTGDRTFVIGYEESFGYLAGTHARDKDAVVSALLICEMAAWHRAQGRTLIEALDGLYAEYGYYLDDLDSFTLKGVDGSQRIQSIMDGLRETGAGLMAGIAEIKDYGQGLDGLPQENVLKYILDDGSWFAVRPSGTEPKIKIYYSIQDISRSQAQERLAAIKAAIKENTNL